MLGKWHELPNCESEKCNFHVKYGNEIRGRTKNCCMWGNWSPPVTINSTAVKTPHLTNTNQTSFTVTSTNKLFCNNGDGTRFVERKPKKAIEIAPNEVLYKCYSID